MRSNEGEGMEASGGDVRDTLETINGIGPKFSMALHQIGVHRFADLAQYTPDELSRALLEQTGVRAPPDRIETNHWIEQAGTLAEQVGTGHTASTDQSEETAETGGEPNSPAWHQHAGFSVFFDYVTDESGAQVWQTRVYHDESGEETLFPGVKTIPWVNWVVKQAKLPATAKPLPTNADVPVPSPTYAPLDIEILNVQISKVEPSPGVGRKALMAEIRFQVSGGAAQSLAAECVPYQVEVHTIDLASGAPNLAASQRGQLQEQQFEYTSKLKFPIPDLGRHEFQSIILVFPPAKIMAFHRGPILEVVP